MQFVNTITIKKHYKFFIANLEIIIANLKMIIPNLEINIPNFAINLLKTINMFFSIPTLIKENQKAKIINQKHLCLVIFSIKKFPFYPPPKNLL